MPTFIDLTNNQYGRLTVIKKDVKPRYWECLCICGNTIIAHSSNLKNHDVSSCGCLRKEIAKIRGSANKKHGYHNTKTYRAWCDIKKRCYNKNCKDYIDYGARGIIVCDRWINSFINFLEDMGMAPYNKSIDRIDNSGNYEPLNCKWSTLSEQNSNRRTYKWKKNR